MRRNCTHRPRSTARVANAVERTSRPSAALYLAAPDLRMVPAAASQECWSFDLCSHQLPARAYARNLPARSVRPVRARMGLKAIAPSIAPADRLLQQILSELRDLRREVAALKPAHQRYLSLDDQRRLTTLLPLIGSLGGDVTFSVASLREAVVETADQRLAVALDQAGSARSVGRWVGRAASATVGGWRVER